MTGYQYRPKPIKAGHQKKETDKLTNRERQRKKEKTKYVIASAMPMSYS